MKIFNRISFFLSLVLVISNFSVARADDGGASVDVGVHQAEVVPLPEGATDVVATDPKIANVVKHSGKKASIVGNSTGKTCVNVMRGNKVMKKMNVTVHPDLVAIRRSLKSLLPAENMGVEMVNHTIALTGQVSNAEAAARAVKIADEFVNNNRGNRQILNLMQIRSGQQVMLKVKVGEMKRTELNKLGLGIQGIISGFQGTVGLLEEKGAFKTLAEPTLTAISGEPAKFLAGGEFPVPIAQANNTMSVDYKKFGVSVDFTPQVLTEKRIRLNVSSEVSELSDVGAVTMNNMKIPGISTRRANTTIELAPGESFMIAGLIKNNTSANLDDVPGLGSIPILNLLFRSTEFKNHESELVIAVTPYLADPTEAKEIQMPGEAYIFPSTLEMFLLGKTQGSAKTPAGSTDTGARSSGLEGPSGFTVD